MTTPSLHAVGSPLEIWGGVECSYVRLPDSCYDELDRTGHAQRPGDLKRFAALGLKTLRYPILWERHGRNPIDWQWADRRLGQLRDLGIRPIVGLLHHGCGPLPGGFLDPGFIPGLANFAHEVAVRFPWIDAYTPINEPLTTARFSGLYGLWHPFKTNSASFARVLLNQCHAIRAAMTAVRKINPGAQLVQTEDIGKTYSTEALVYQADWENERRWVSFDLLCGTLDSSRPMWNFLRWSRIREKELESFQSNPCPPDILGMNHYVTGERLLDQRLEYYPPGFHGGNGQQAYADVPAVRARVEGLQGFKSLLTEMWQRYRRPLALTEVQLACTREEQVRWLHEAWTSAVEVRAEGGDVRAVTAWALVGALDWDSLLLRRDDRYESGAFELAQGSLRKTAVGSAVHLLATTGTLSHPLLSTPGWWRRRGRLLHVEDNAAGAAEPSSRAGDGAPHPILLIGAVDGVAVAFADRCEQRGLTLENVPHAALMDPGVTRHLLQQHRPWGIVLVWTHSSAARASNDPMAGGHLKLLRSLCKADSIVLANFRPGLDSCPTPLAPGVQRTTDDIDETLDRLVDGSFHQLDQTPESHDLTPDLRRAERLDKYRA